MKLKRLWPLLAALVLLTALPAAAQVEIENDFEQYEAGELPKPPFDCRETGTGLVRVAEESGESYVSISSQGVKTDQGFLQYVPKPALEGMLNAEFDFRLDSKNAKIAIPEIRDTPNKKTASFFTINTDGTIQVGEAVAMNYEPGVWYHAKVCANLEEKKYAVWLTDQSGTAKRFDGTIAAQLINVEYIRFPVYGSLVTAGLTTALHLDNILIRMDGRMELVSASPAQGQEDALPGAPLKLQFANALESLSLRLNGTQLTPREILLDENGGCVITPDMPMEWGTAYLLEGTAADAYGTSCAVSLSFSTRPQPEHWIEFLGFYDGSGSRLSALQSGPVTARLRFQQKSPASYTVVAGLYRQNQEAVELLALSCVGQKADTLPCEAQITLQVPEEYENCFIRTFVWDGLGRRLPYAAEFYSGDSCLR